MNFLGGLATRFHITKYPTLKVIRNGQPAKREYRGQRSVEAFVEFVKKQLEDTIKEFTSLKEIAEIDVSLLFFELNQKVKFPQFIYCLSLFQKKVRAVIGYFPQKDIPEYKVFRRVAANLKEDCQFYVGFGYDSFFAELGCNESLFLLSTSFN